MSELLMEIENLGKIYTKDSEELVSIENINFSVNKGELISIVGPSGCGKTTLLEILSGLRLATSGTVKIKGETILGPHRSIGVVFQEESTFPWRNVQENVEFGLQMQGVPKAEYKERESKMIDLVGLKGFENSYP